MPLSKPNLRLPFKSGLVDENSFPFKTQFNPTMALMKHELSNLSTKSLDLSSNSSVDSEPEQMSFRSMRANQCDSIDLRIETKKNKDKPFSSLFGSMAAESTDVDPEQRKLVIVENDSEMERQSTGDEQNGIGQTVAHQRSPSTDRSSLSYPNYFQASSPGGASCSSSCSSDRSLKLTVAVGSEQSDALLLNRRMAPSQTVVTIHHGHPSKGPLKDYSIESIISKRAHDQLPHFEPLNN